MSAEEDDRREQLAFMVDAILRTVNNLKENFHMYETATMQVLNIARQGMTQPTQVIEPPVQPVNRRAALSTVQVDEKKMARKGSVTSLKSQHIKAATLLLALFSFFNKTNALAAVRSAPIKVLPKMASNIAKNSPISPISPQILARLFKNPGSEKIVDALDKSHDFIQNIVDFVKKAKEIREKNRAKGGKSYRWKSCIRMKLRHVRQIRALHVFRIVPNVDTILNGVSQMNGLIGNIVIAKLKIRSKASFANQKTD